jgi:hypothetical protein
MLAPQGHDLDAAIAVAFVLVVFRYPILRLVLGVLAVVVLAALVFGGALLAQALHL